MNRAGLDIATTTGLACIKEGVITTHTIKWTPPKKAKGLDPAKESYDAEYVFGKKEDGNKIDPVKEGMIARHFEDRLRLWLITNDIGEVAIEMPIASNTTRKKEVVDQTQIFAGKARSFKVEAGTSMSAIFRIYGLEMIACAVCARLNIPVVFVSQGTWRKEFLGNGRPKDAKHEAKKKCESLGIQITSLDAAEAAGICWYLDKLRKPYSHRAAEDLFNATA